MIHNSSQRGFTLIELLIVIAIMVVITVFALNPAQYLSQARNNARKAHVNLILNTIYQNITANDGTFSCSTGAVPTTTALRMATSTGTSTYDIAPCLAPTYLPDLPFDPRASSTASTTYWTSVTNYNTGYTIQKSATTSRITIVAPYAELGETISVTR